MEERERQRRMGEEEEGREEKESRTEQNRAEHVRSVITATMCGLSTHTSRRGERMI